MPEQKVDCEYFVDGNCFLLESGCANCTKYEKASSQNFVPVGQITRENATGLLGN